MARTMTACLHGYFEPVLESLTTNIVFMMIFGDLVFNIDGMLSVHIRIASYVAILMRTHNIL